MGFQDTMLAPVACKAVTVGMDLERILREAENLGGDRHIQNSGSAAEAALEACVMVVDARC